MHDAPTFDAALALLLRTCVREGYHFVTPTPLTHARWLGARPGRRAASLRDAFGWNLPFALELLPEPLRSTLQTAGVVIPHADGWRSEVRVSTLAGQAFVHSAFPTTQPDAVFFGPDTYRFASFLERALASDPPRPGARLLDVGCGSGAGGIVAAQHVTDPVVVMNDINPLALRHTAVNAAAAGIEVELSLGDALASSTGELDLIVCNPPYLTDEHERVYRHGGEHLGRALSLRIVEESLGRLAPRGRLLLYTGVAIVDGRDPFLAEISGRLEAAGMMWTYREIDPDVFGEELERPTYAVADRIAAVELTVVRR